MTENRWRVEYIFRLLNGSVIVKRFVKSVKQQCAPPQKQGDIVAITATESTYTTIRCVQGVVVGVEKCLNGFFARVRATITTDLPLHTVEDWFQSNNWQEIAEEPEKI